MWLALVAYMPALMQSPGRVSADTKTYLYLDPLRLMSTALDAWDPSTGAGMVTHQKIGYLWPMGPYFLSMDRLGVPDWVAQRLWWGSLIFIAALGVRSVARRIGFGPEAAVLAALAYSMSPYVFQYLARLSGLLLPWVGFPWLVYTVLRARSDNSWRWPIATGLIVMTVGSLNATTVFMVLVGWFVWMVADVWAGDFPPRPAVMHLLKSTVAILALNLWWLVGLLVQGRYGVPILRYTESYETIAESSTPLEILRGLGYWFFYGGDQAERWVGPSSDYLQNRIVLLASLTLVALGLVALCLYRGRARIQIAVVLLVGLGVSVGATPIDSPSVYGRIFRAVVSMDIGGVLRSTPRAAPLVILALSLVLSHATIECRDWLRRRAQRTRQQSWMAALVVPGLVVLLAVNFFPWFIGNAMTDWITRDEALPDYWREAATAIDQSSDPNTGHGRTYEFPGIEFASYTWGGTIDPITPGLIDDGYIAREQVPIGSEPTMDLLSAVESRLQEGRAEGSLIWDFARLISATAVDWRADLNFTSFGTPNPAQMAEELPGLIPADPIYVGPAVPVDTEGFRADPRFYSRRRAAKHPAVVVWRVDDTRPLVTSQPVETLTYLSGSGQGVVDALAANVLDPRETFVYDASRPYLPKAALPRHLSHFILTDSNRRAARSWSAVSRNEGRTEQATEVAPRNRRDSRLMPFVDDPTARATADQQSTSVLIGKVRRVETDLYGLEFGYLPEDRAENVVDGDLSTAWRTGGQGDARGRHVTISYFSPQVASEVTLVAPVLGRDDRPISSGIVTLLDGKGRTLRTLEYLPQGRRRVTLTFPRTEFVRLRFEITGDLWSDEGQTIDSPTTGLAEIIVDGAASREYVLMPASGADLQQIADRVSVVATRWRSDSGDVERADPEPTIRRIFTLSAPRDFAGGGLVRPSGDAGLRLAGDFAMDSIVVSNGSLPGSNRSQPARALDGDLRTSWVSPLPLTRSPEFRLSLRPPDGSGPLTMIAIDDATHSVPTSARVTDASGRKWVVDLQRTVAPRDGDAPAGAVALSADMPAEFRYPLTGIRLTALLRRTTLDAFSTRTVSMPVEIVEMYLGNRNTSPVRLATHECRSDLVLIDGSPVAVRISDGTSDPALDGPYRFELCGVLQLGTGSHFIDAAPGSNTGFDVDQLWLDSLPAGSTPGEALRGSGMDLATTSGSSTRIVDYNGHRLSVDVNVEGPSVLAFAQSASRGWSAMLTSDGETEDLGRSFVVNGYANGWLIPHSGRLVIEWTPQRRVNQALTTSLVSLLGAITYLVLRRRHGATRAAEPLMFRGGRGARWMVSGILGLLGGPVPALVTWLSFRARRSVVAVILAFFGATVGAIVIVMQGRFGYLATVTWPGHFDYLIMPTWAAVGASVGASLSDSDLIRSADVARPTSEDGEGRRTRTGGSREPR